MSKPFKETLTLDNLATNFGTDMSNFSSEFIRYYNTRDWRYDTLEKDELDYIVIDALSYIMSDTQRVGEPSRKDVWNNGWAENLNLYFHSKNLNDLIPKFIRKNFLVRLNQEFVKVANLDFELDFLRLLHRFFFSAYMQPYTSVYEFGCGSGFNLSAMAQLIPGKKLYGCDFVQSSVELISIIAENLQVDLKGVSFDMSNPNYDFKLDKNSCVFTLGSIEQIPRHFKNFIDYLVFQKPDLCIHIEPMFELYDPTNLVDYTARLFHSQRGYTIGLLTYLKELEDKGTIEIQKTHRMRFGSFRMEGYNYVIWRPK